MKTLLSIIILLSAIPLGFLVKSLTKHEKQIYKKYFPSMLWILAILAAIFYSLNIQIALTLTFMFIFVFFWNWENLKI